jgi:hypothetical protein
MQSKQWLDQLTTCTGPSYRSPFRHFSRSHWCWTREQFAICVQGMRQQIIFRSQHNEYRTLNNLQLVEQALFRDLEGNYTSHWRDSLLFLRQLQHEPPPFRQPLTTKIRWWLEQHVSESILKVVELNNEALKPIQHHSSHQHNNFDPWPLLQLQILFEQLVLFPINPAQPRIQKRPYAWTT